MQLMLLLKNLNLIKVFFAYSPRPGTPSSLICDSVPKDLKKKIKTLLDLNKKHVTEHNLKLLIKRR